MEEVMVGCACSLCGETINKYRVLLRKLGNRSLRKLRMGYENIIKDISRKKHIYNAIIKSILLHGCDVWQLGKGEEQRIMATGMDYWRRAAGISRLERIRNERVREIMRVDGNTVENMRKKQLIRYGHVKST
jgi:hypothetical protein